MNEQGRWSKKVILIQILMHNSDGGAEDCHWATLGRKIPPLRKCCIELGGCIELGFLQLKN